MPTRKSLGKLWNATTRSRNGTTEKSPTIWNTSGKAKTARKPFHELVVQVGDRNDTGIRTADAAKAKDILTDCYHEFVSRNPNMRLFNAVLHMDEPDGTPHLHIDFIPLP